MDLSPARAPSPANILSAPAAVPAGPRTWRVTMQNGFARFMFQGGPRDVTQYNFAVMSTRINAKLVEKIPFCNANRLLPLDVR